MPKPTGASEHTPTAPLLPPASIDFNALHDACAQGLSPEDALAAALIEMPGAELELTDAAEAVPEAVAEPAAPQEPDASAVDQF